MTEVRVAGGKVIPEGLLAAFWEYEQALMANDLAALDALFSLGRPRRVQLCVLIDRGHRELPIEAAFIGRKVQTTASEVIEVKLTEIDGLEKVVLMER